MAAAPSDFAMTLRIPELFESDLAFLPLHRGHPESVPEVPFATLVCALTWDVRPSGTDISFLPSFFGRATSSSILLSYRLIADRLSLSAIRVRSPIAGPTSKSPTLRTLAPQSLNSSRRRGLLKTRLNVSGSSWRRRSSGGAGNGSPVLICSPGLTCIRLPLCVHPCRPYCMWKEADSCLRAQVPTQSSDPDCAFFVEHVVRTFLRDPGAAEYHARRCAYIGPGSVRHDQDWASVWQPHLPLQLRGLLRQDLLAVLSP